MSRSRINGKHLIRSLGVVMIGLMILSGSLLVGNAAQKTTTKSLKEMIEHAKTAEDHQAIASQYRANAAKTRADAVEHDKMAALYRQTGQYQGSKRPYAAGTPEHCDRIVKDFRAAADEMVALAKEHQEMADKVK